MSKRVSGEREPRYDVYISYASVDKESVACPLAKALMACGLKVAYDETKLRVGDSIVGKINERITISRFTVIIVSKDYLEERWTAFELDTLLHLAVYDDRTIIPIWHNITNREVGRHRPYLACLIGRSTCDRQISAIAQEIARVVLAA